MSLREHDVQLFSLFYVDDKHSSHANLESGEASPVDVYLQCGTGLASSCRHWGIPYKIITNRKDFLDSRLAYLGGAVETVEQTFDRAVPEGIPFYSAHYKLDVVRAFGAGRYGAAAGLVDIDAVMAGRLNLPPLNDRTLVVYDITEQVRPAYGDDVILSDLKLIGGPGAERPYWYGGELIVGAPGAFSRLSAAIDDLWPAYCSHWRELHHAGDEMIVTPALERLRREGTTLIDAGRAGIIARWWSVRTGHVQKPFDAISSASILHLPADKLFLAERSKQQSDAGRFVQEYRAYISPKLRRRRLMNVFHNVKEGKTKHAARLA
jgi:hypothetical protein